MQSEKNRGFYTGYTRDIYKRLDYHNSGKVKATRHLTPFKVVYSEVYQSATEARKREYYLKSQKSKKFIEDLIARGRLAQGLERCVDIAEVSGSIPLPPTIG